MVDPERDWMSNVYYMDRGERFQIPDGPLQRPSLVAVNVDTRKPLLFGTQEEVIKAGGTQAPRSGEKVDRNESFLGVPIMTGDKVIGGINVQSYEQNAFNQDDLRLLQTLANSMSVALQNAQSFKAEQERFAELQIINSIQQGLAAELDFQAIVDLVGDKLREVFNTGDFGIRWYDEKNNLVHFLYEYEHGERLDIPPQPPNPGGTFDLFLKDRQPIVANTAELAARTGGTIIEGTDMSKSIIAVPIITSDRLTGSLQIENYERENAYGESELRLLTTIAASLGTALENARLFDETQQRNAELAIINAVQGALAAELDTQGIYEAVGEKLREIFNYQDVSIYTADLMAHTMTVEYSFEKGQRLERATVPMNSLYEHIVEANKTLVFNGNGAEFAAQFTDYKVPGGQFPKSLLIVPVHHKKGANKRTYSNFAGRGWQNCFYRLKCTSTRNACQRNECGFAERAIVQSRAGTRR